ncbi:NAD(P)(+) transhydrogenase (Re/Si-specific) subunit beta [Stakelama tenebrarum]|uniref:NAD(P)(+) transhydrogenase (Re/Si-specific) subunit beta n=1 Tax=Stakelama tenebrarum TaxID=2711215 RepID=A0A6G6Y694_9SPHN|nr:NAD(P)(+) transhydrogenase (Re/Si-specific) subunit beta [Sphingosinithalassobacter tenebrarum]QIG80103.1 NAD(P)(+) transhydrogenase (Re/Si-specific) subunit beta [Sphingosinithalassobacter tenebrarum]
MRDMHSGMLAVSAIGAAALSADNTPAAIDLQGYNAAEILLAIGIGGITFSGTNKIEFVLTHSDDDTTYTAVDAEDMLGLETVGEGGIIKALTSAHAAADVYRFGYVGGKRYLKLLADFSGTHGSGTPIAAVVLKGRGYNQPEVDQA